jgi:hypothetical protein
MLAIVASSSSPASMHIRRYYGYSPSVMRKCVLQIIDAAGLSVALIERINHQVQILLAFSSREKGTCESKAVATCSHLW